MNSKSPPFKGWAFFLLDRWRLGNARLLPGNHDCVRETYQLPGNHGSVRETYQLPGNHGCVRKTSTAVKAWGRSR